MTNASTRGTVESNVSVVVAIGPAVFRACSGRDVDSAKRVVGVFLLDGFPGIAVDSTCVVGEMREPISLASDVYEYGAVTVRVVEIVDVCLAAVVNVFPGEVVVSPERVVGAPNVVPVVVALFPRKFTTGVLPRISSGCSICSSTIAGADIFFISVDALCVCSSIDRVASTVEVGSIMFV